MSTPTALERQLHDCLAAISISQPEPGELEARGIGRAHFEQTFVELARHLLAQGASIAYGGDLRVRGFTRTLVELVRTYPVAEQPARERVQLYPPWPVWERADMTERANIKLVATVVPGPAPDDAAPKDAETERGPELTARALTSMREQMTARLDARILLGGRLVGSSGRYPGLAEEAALALRAGKPLFVIGGFGGCAGRLGALLRDGDAPELTAAFQAEHSTAYAHLLGELPDIDWEALLTTVRSAGLNGLRNGLSEHDNATLMETVDVDLVVALVLRGLRAVARSA